MSNRKYDIYIGCTTKHNSKDESIEEFTKKIIGNILSRVQLSFSMTNQVGGYSYSDGTYVVEESVKITIIGSFSELDISLFISNLKEFFDQETVLLSVSELEMEYK